MFPFFAIKLGHFKVKCIFFRTNTQTWQQKSECEVLWDWLQLLTMRGSTVVCWRPLKSLRCQPKRIGSVESFQANFGLHYRLGRNLNYFLPKKHIFFTFWLLTSRWPTFWPNFQPFLLMGYLLFILTLEFEIEIPIYSQKVPKTHLLVWSHFKCHNY